MISWLLIVTSLSGIFALVYGIVATLHDFHVQKGNKRLLSKMGYVGLSILIVSSLLGLAVDGIRKSARRGTSDKEMKRRTSE